MDYISLIESKNYKQLFDKLEKENIIFVASDLINYINDPKFSDRLKNDSNFILLKAIL